MVTNQVVSPEPASAVSTDTDCVFTRILCSECEPSLIRV